MTQIYLQNRHPLHHLLLLEDSLQLTGLVDINWLALANGSPVVLAFTFEAEALGWAVLLAWP